MKRLLLLFLALVSAYGLGAEPRAISLDEAVTIAISQNLGLRGQRYLLDTKELNKNNAWNAFLPTLSVGSSFIKNNEASTYNPNNYWMLGASLEATLDFSAALFNGLDYVIKEYAKGEIQYEEAERSLRRNVKKTFYTILELQKNQKLIEDKIETAKSRYDQAQRNFSAGIASEFDVLSAQVGYENLKPVLGNFQQAYRSTVNSFKILLLGMKREEEITLQGVIQTEKFTLELGPLLGMAQGKSPSVQLMRQEVELLKSSLTGLQVQAYTPFLRLSYSQVPSYSTLKDPLENDIFQDIENDYSDQGSFSLTLGLQLNSFLPFDKKGTSIQGMENTLKSLETSLAQVIISTEVEVENLFSTLENTARQIRTLELNEALAQKAYQLAEEGYRTGVRTLLELKNSEDDLSQSQLEVNSARVRYIQTLFDLEYVLGSLPHNNTGAKNE